MTRDSWEAAPPTQLPAPLNSMKQAVKVFTASRLFIYYNERVMEGTVKSDSGAQIRDTDSNLSDDFWTVAKTAAQLAAESRDGSGR